MCITSGWEEKKTSEHIVRHAMVQKQKFPFAFNNMIIHTVHLHMANICSRGCVCVPFWMFELHEHRVRHCKQRSREKSFRIQALHAENFQMDETSKILWIYFSCFCLDKRTSKIIIIIVIRVCKMNKFLFETYGKRTHEDVCGCERRIMWTSFACFCRKM